ncbi:OTP-paired class homeobox protein, partial [Zopfochytrium polystomum]
KSKRRRATAAQLAVLNSVLATTFFPSTELRQSLAARLGMSPRAVQIWFQNRRQNWRTMAR